MYASRLAVYPRGAINTSMASKRIKLNVVTVTEPE